MNRLLIIFLLLISVLSFANAQTTIGGAGSTYISARQVIFDGNSMTYGGPVEAYPVKVMRTLGAAWQSYNFGVNGQSTPNMTSDAVAQIDGLFDARRRKNIVVAWEMGNDFYSNSVTAAQAFANMKTYCQARKNAGFKVIVLTETDRTSFTNAAFAAGNGPANTLLRADFPTAVGTLIYSAGEGITYADLLYDTASDALLSNPSNTTYFYDGCHMTDAGYTVVAEGVSATVLLVP